MKRFFFGFILLFLAFSAFGQKMVYDWGYTTGGAKYTTGVTLDTTTGTASNIVFYLGEKDIFPFDINPLAVADSGAGTSAPLVSTNSDRFYLGTFYCNFDNQGTASPTTDSILFTIKAYPGVLTQKTNLTSAKWGTAVTLETIRVKNDYFSINNVYVHASKYKIFPPEVVKLEIAPIGDKDCDDSTFVSWRLVYPISDSGVF